MSDQTVPNIAQTVTIQHRGEAEFAGGTSPLPYTSNPWRLFISDLLLFVKNAWSLPCIVWPFTPCNSGPLDELAPTAANLFAIAVHVTLSLAQVAFLVSLLVCVVSPVPFGIVLLYVIGFVSTNYLLCQALLNGWKPTLESSVDISYLTDKHEDEKWIFLNGVAAGHHWLQTNIDRISLTFGRKVLGIHNPTVGIVFDVLQCLMQRDFAHVSQDIRNGYTELKEALTNAKYKKIVFILHSQGGIEGGLILDWLYAEMSREVIEKLEVYTFGNAANHFNNPVNVLDVGDINDSSLDEKLANSSPFKTIKHIEHYANSSDFVSRWGVLHFASNTNFQGRTNRYAGRVFERYGAGHQFNQHYLDNMFPLEKGPDGLRASEKNAFMDAEVQITEAPRTEASQNTQGSTTKDSVSPGPKVTIRNLTFPPSANSSLLSLITRPSKNRVSYYSRLWQYRNGRSPQD